MKKIFITLLAFFSLTFANAKVDVTNPENCAISETSKSENTTQVDRQKEREKIQALKVGYMTEQIGLSPGESEKFWPIYNQYWKERRDLAHQTRDLFRRIEKGEVHTDDITLFLSLKDNENATMRRWTEKFKTVLSPEKTVKVFVAEENFKRFLLNKAGNKPN